jgi:hypothetical protein
MVTDAGPGALVRVTGRPTTMLFDMPGDEKRENCPTWRGWNYPGDATEDRWWTGSRGTPRDGREEPGGAR